MLPDIGIMIAAYIFVRMVSFLTRTGDHKESVIVKVFAVITIIVTIFCAFDLLLMSTIRSSSIEKLLK